MRFGRGGVRGRLGRGSGQGRLGRDSGRGQVVKSSWERSGQGHMSITYDRCGNEGPSLRDQMFRGSDAKRKTWMDPKY